MADTHPDETRTPRSEAFFESRLFALLPGGVLPGSIFLFAVVVALLAGGILLFERDSLPVWLGGDGRLLVIILIELAIPVIALAAERWSQIRLRREAPLPRRADGRPVDLDPAPDAREHLRLRIATGIGLAIGLASLTLFVAADLQGDLSRLSHTTEAIPALVMTVIFILLGRAVARTFCMARLVRAILADGVVADPARPEPFHVFGRLALRQASVWFAIALAMFVLLLVGLRGYLFQLVFALTVAAGALTFWSLIRPPQRILAAARQTALEEVRDRMDGLRPSAFSGEAGAASAYAALAAEEARLEKASDWPVSAPVTRSVIVFGAGPALAWFGAALAERIVSSLTGS